MKKIIFLLLGMTATHLSWAAPADGKGNKFVEEIDIDGAMYVCPDGNLMNIDVDGWIQGKVFDAGQSRNVQLTVFHLNVTYTNDQGDSLKWLDRGPDRLYFVKNSDGIEELHVAVNGRAGINNIGHLVLNLDTQEVVLLAGRRPFGGEVEDPVADVWACETLY